MQEILAYSLVITAITYLVWRSLNKKKGKDEGNCNSCG
jgi:hypothetical protein